MTMGSLVRAFTLNSKWLIISAMAAFMTSVEYRMPMHCLGPWPNGKNFASSRSNFKSM